MFFFTGFCTQCQCPGEKYLLKPTEQVAAQVSCCLVLSLCFCDLVTLVLCRKECSCLMPVAVVLYVSLMGVLQRRKQKAAKSKVLDQIKSSDFNGNFAPLSTFAVFVSP